MNASHLSTSIGLQLQHLLHQKVSLFGFDSGRLGGPGWPLLHQGVCVKDRQPECLRAYGHILDVEPLLAPSLHRLQEVDLEVLDIRSSLHSKTTRSLDAVLTLDAEDAAKQPKVGRNAQEALTKNEEARNVQKPIGRKIVQLHPIKVHQCTKKVVNREGESPVHKIHKTDPLIGAWARDYLGAGDANLRLVRRNQPVVAQAGEHPLAAGGLGPGALLPLQAAGGGSGAAICRGVRGTPAFPRRGLRHQAGGGEKLGYRGYGDVRRGRRSSGGGEQMASKSTIYFAARFLTSKLKRIRTVGARSWAKQQIQSYTWQPWRATVAGHFSHYARESRNCHHSPEEIVPERSNPVQTAVPWAHKTCHVPSIAV